MSAWSDTGVSGDEEFWDDADLPVWPFRLALLLGLELWGIFFALLHRASGHSVSYDMAAAMAPSILVALPVGFVARRWGQEWWTSARLGTVVVALGLGGLLLTNLGALREQWLPTESSNHFVAMPEHVGQWQQLTDSASILATEDQVEPLRQRDHPAPNVTSRVFTTSGDRHVAQLILITPDPKGRLRQELQQSRAGVVRQLLEGAGATRPSFVAAGNGLGGRMGCGESVTRGSSRTVTCAWAARTLAGVVVFFADGDPSVSWAGKQARDFRAAVERATPE